MAVLIVSHTKPSPHPALSRVSFFDVQRMPGSGPGKVNWGCGNSESVTYPWLSTSRSASISMSDASALAKAMRR